jgi:hypothetical protein
MAEVKLAAGAKIDVLNRKELKEALDIATRDWFNQVARGDRYRRFSASAEIDGSGGLSIGGAAARDAALGPAEGFVWAVQRIAVYGLTSATGTPLVATTEPLQLFLNDDGPASLVDPALVGYRDFGNYALVMYPGDTLLVRGTALTSTGTATVTGQVREVPLPLAWRLGG